MIFRRYDMIYGVTITAPSFSPLGQKPIHLLCSSAFHQRTDVSGQMKNIWAYSRQTHSVDSDPVWYADIVAHKHKERPTKVVFT